MDYESWFSVTHEKIAKHIAERAPNEIYSMVIDGFAGVGGNIIQYAMDRWKVIAVEID